MAEMSVIWLRVAVAFYSVGLLHAIIMLVRKRERIFRVSLAAVTIGAVLHCVSIVDEGLLMRHCPIANFYETCSMCAFLITVLFLFVYWRYRTESLGVIIFPLIFVMTLVSTFGNPVEAWTNPALRNAWLDVHITLVLLGFAALAVTAGASLLYLFQEHELKRKKPRKSYYRLPPLGTLDELISRSMALGFVLMTLAVIAATTWTFIEHKTQWIAEPAIAISFITWGCYLAMVFLRITAGWRGRKAAIMVIVVVGLSAITWVAHARLGVLLPKP